MKNKRILLLCIITGGLFLRLWGIDFGLPNIRCRPDEEFFAASVLMPMQHFHPRDFIYPSLFRYIVLIFYGIYFCFGLIFGVFKNAHDFAMMFAIDPSVFYLINRVISALFGVATIYVVFRLGKRLASERVGIIAAFFMSVTYLHVRNSHFGVTDVAMTFFSTMAIDALVGMYQKKTPVHYCVAGIWAGLAMSTKYPAVFLVFAAWYTHILNIFFEKGKRLACFIDARILLFFAASILFFLVGTPFALLDYKEFLKDSLSALQATAVNGVYFNEAAPRFSWWYHLSFNVWYGMSGVLSVISFLGIIVFLKKEWRLATIVLTFPFLILIIAGSGFQAMSRYMLPAIPVLSITAAMAVEWLIATKFPGSKRQGLMMMCIVVGIGLSTLIDSMQFCSLLAKTDTRVQAAHWINANIPTQSSIAQLITNPYARVALYPSEEQLMLKQEHNDDDIRRTGKGKNRGELFGYLLEYGRTTKQVRFTEWEYDEKNKEFKVGLTVQEGLPAYIIWIGEQLDEYGSMLLADQYVLIKKFSPYQPKQSLSNMRFERWDAFFLPYSGFQGVIRPGPEIYIYERKLPEIS